MSYAPVIGLHSLRHRLLYSSGNSCPFLRNETHICTLCSRVSHPAYTWSHKVQWLSFLSRTANVSRLNIIPCALKPIVLNKNSAINTHVQLKNASAFLPRRAWCQAPSLMRDCDPPEVLNPLTHPTRLRPLPAAWPSRVPS